MAPFRQLLVVAGCFLFWSCNQTSDIPFSEVLAEKMQPETVPLEMTAPKKLHWDTVKTSAITPTVFHLDFSRMKGEQYDKDGFKPLPSPPSQSSFDFDALPSKPLDLSKIPAQPLKMEMKPLTVVQSTLKYATSQRVMSSTLDMREWPLAGNSAGPFFMKRDTSGILWFGNSNGLFRLDGASLTNMVGGPTFGLNIDKKGRIWFLKQNAQFSTINILDLENRTIGSFQLPFAISIAGSVFLSNDGMLWVSALEPTPGVLRIDPEKMSYQVIDKKNDLVSDRFLQISEDGEKNIWITSFNGLYIIDQKSNTLKHFDKKNGLISDTTASVIRGMDGRMWVAQSEGVAVIDLKNKIISEYKNPAGHQARSFKLFFDKTGQLWVGGLNSLWILNIENNTVRNVKTDVGISNTSVLDMVEDDAGNIILSSIKPDGRPFPGTFLVIGNYGKTAYPFGNKDIYSAVEDSREHLWIGTGSQLFIIDSARKTYWKIDSSSGLANNVVQSVTARNGNIVITTDNGYNIFDAEKSELYRFGKSEGMFADTVFSVVPDEDGNQWICATGDGIYKYNPVSKITLQLNKEGGLNGSYAIETVPLKNKNIWVITDGTPGYIDPASQTIQVIKNLPEIGEASEKSIFVDSHDRIWIGLSSLSTAGGLFMIDNQKKTISKFTVKNGLSDNHCYSILGKDGKIFVGAHQKVNIITPPELSPSKKWEIQILKGSENLEKIARSYASDAITARGTYIWGDDGARIIYGLNPDTLATKTIISGLDLMAQSVDFRTKNDTLSRNNDLTDVKWDSLSKPYFMPVNLKLPYDRNVMQFHFSELNAIRSDTVRYAYILEGLEKKWTTTTDKHTQTYLNLDPGDYTFKVRNRSAGNKWSDPATLSFTINPPWYNTWWAYLIYIILGILLIRTYLEIRSRKLKKENKILEEKVLHRTEELERSYNNVEQLGQIGRKITSSLSVEKIIGTAYNNVNVLMDASVFGIGIYNAQNETLDFPATYEKGQQLPFYSNSIHDKNRFGAICFNSGKEFIMGNLDEQYKDYIQQLPDPHAGDQSVSLVYLPLTINEKKLGVITVQSFKKNAYSENHLNMLRNIANYTAIALENAESYSKLNQSLINLRDTQAQLIQSEKMASLGELTAGIAHEIQNPLNFVNNFSDVNMELLHEMQQEISKGNFDDAKLLSDDILGNEQKINHHGKRADAIVKGMLQHSRNNSGHRELTDINALADEYLRLSFHGLRAKNKSFNATMKTDFDPSLSANGGRIYLVSQDVGRVILNLINNAFYAVTERKNNNADNYEPTVTVTTRKKQDHVEVRIADNGIGIPQNIVEKIFHPFFTTKPTGQGTGLGLSLSYDIIKAHGGELKFSTKEGKGTEFVIELPMA